ncbi:ester cyclase [Bauldia sp.]|uniref:ester cyclase n=1 Tax=Bauldia sp. TaxID=2575872 RepID=UPI003BA8FB06
MAELRRCLPLTVLVSVTLFIAQPSLANADDTDSVEKIAYESIELWMSGTDVTPEEVFAPDYVNHVDSPISDQAPSDRDIEELKKELAQFHAAFSDVHVTSSEQVAEGNLVATRVVISAKHTGSFVGEEPTGTTVTYDSVEFTRVEDGKIAETWVTWDKYGLYRQIGALPNNN